MKRILGVVILCLLFLVVSAGPASAAEITMVVDQANLCSPEAAAVLEEQAQQLSGQYEMDIAILTVPSLNGMGIQEYADDYYDQYYGEDGLLLLISMEERECFFSTCGKMRYILTDYGIQKLGETALPYWQSGDYSGGFGAILDALPKYLDAYQDGSAIDGTAVESDDFYLGDGERTLYYEEDSSPNLLLSLGIGVLTAAVTIFIMRSQMNSNKPQRGAAGYLQKGSFHMHTRQDLFLYSNVSKVRRQQNASNGGGSSVHRSSSGRSHGGGGGKF